MHTRFRLVQTSVTLDDLERHYALHCTKHGSFGVHHENLNEDKPRPPAALDLRMSVSVLCRSGDSPNYRTKTAILLYMGKSRLDTSGRAVRKSSVDCGN